MKQIHQVYRSHILTKAGHTSCCNSQSKHKQTTAYSRRFMVLWSSLDLIAKCSFLPAFKWGTLLSILMTVHVSVDLIFCSHLKPCGPSLTAKWQCINLGGLVRTPVEDTLPSINWQGVQVIRVWSWFRQIPLPSICYCLFPQISNRCGN